MILTVATIALALVVDQLLGEPRRWHPLVGFGHVAAWLERRTNLAIGPRAAATRNLAPERMRWPYTIMPLTLNRQHGVFALSCMCGVPFLLASILQIYLLQQTWWIALGVEAAVLYLAIGRQSLRAHALVVARALRRNDMVVARLAVSHIVTRDTERADAQAVSAAAVETVLENGSDAIFASLFWFIVAGIPGVVLQRTSNTLDAMWGYRNARFDEFGWAAAKLDDLLNYLPARLTALAYAACGHTRVAWHCWRTQAARWSSPNAGPVMAAGAGALGLQLGGDASYGGRVERRPVLGEGRAPHADDIRRALRLIDYGVALWLAILLALAGLGWWWR
jgi:adenosylcobinamide-phosphate synthase